MLIKGVKITVCNATKLYDDWKNTSAWYVAETYKNKEKVWMSMSEKEKTPHTVKQMAESWQYMMALRYILITRGLWDAETMQPLECNYYCG